MSDATTTTFQTRLSPPTEVSITTLSGDGHAVDISKDGLACTVLFDKRVQVTLDEKDEANALCAILSLSFPINIPTTEYYRGIASILRGFVSKKSGTRVTVMADMGGTVALVEYPYGQDFSGDLTKASFSFDGFTATRPKADGTGTEQVQLPPSAHCTLAVTITIQRRVPLEPTVVRFDSLDIEIIDPDTKPAPATGQSAKH